MQTNDGYIEDEGISATAKSKAMAAASPITFECLESANSPHKSEEFRMTPEEALVFLIDSFRKFHPRMGAAAQAILDQERYDLEDSPFGCGTYPVVPDMSESNLFFSPYPPKAGDVKPEHRHLSFVDLPTVPDADGKIGVEKILSLFHEMAHGIAFDLAHEAGNAVEPVAASIGETFSLLGERIGAYAMLQRAAPEQKYSIASGYCSNINGMLTATAKNGEGSFGQKDATYIFGLLASEELFVQWVEGDPRERAAIAGSVVSVMEKGNTVNFGKQFGAQLGMDNADFPKNGLEHKRYFDKEALAVLSSKQQHTTVHDAGYFR